MYQSDLDLQALLNRISDRWQQLTGEPLAIGSLEWAYLQVLVMVASWSKIDTEKAIIEALARYRLEITALPFGAGNKDAIVALAKAFTDVADVNVMEATTPMNIPVYLLAKTGTPTAIQINSLQNYLNSSRVKNTCDTFVVAAATQLTWNLAANIVVTGDPLVLKNKATDVVMSYAASKLKLGTSASIILSDITTAIRSIAGITDVSVSNPVTNVLISANQFPKIGTVTITTSIT